MVWLKVNLKKVVENTRDQRNSIPWSCRTVINIHTRTKIQILWTASKNSSFLPGWWLLTEASFVAIRSCSRLPEYFAQCFENEQTRYVSAHCCAFLSRSSLSKNQVSRTHFSLNAVCLKSSSTRTEQRFIISRSHG